MSQELRLSFFGSFQARIGAENITRNFSNKAQALLGYLALQPYLTHNREKLATLLWPESSDEKASRSLRVELSKIRDVVSDYLEITRQTITWDRESNYWVDVEAFEHLVAQSKRGVERSQEKAWLSDAVALYQGDFLSELRLDETTEFEEWLVFGRTRLREMVMSALDRLAQICIEEKDYVTGIVYAQRGNELDPWQEEPYRQLMWLYAQNGQRIMALNTYETCRTFLWQKLGVEPADETTQLYRYILQMPETAVKPLRPFPHPPQPVSTPQIPFHAPSLTVNFVGRQLEIAAITQQLLQNNNTSSQRYSLVGLGGIGKTTLATYVAHTLKDEFADGVLWANAAIDSPTIIAESWAAAYGYDFTGLSDFEAQAAALRHLLASKKVLIILDDVTMASGLRPLLPQSSNSVVLVTTRRYDQAQLLQAQPIDVGSLEAKDGRLLLTQIVGIDRVTHEPDATAEICRLLYNHPLALTLAAKRLASRPRHTLADFAHRLHDQTTRLDLDSEDREVRASFAVSWQGLDSTQKQVFAMLAVFEERPFTADALAAVLQLDRYITQDQLDLLVNLSLLGQEGQRHYRQHPLLADFSREKLGTDDSPYPRMVEYYLRYAQTHQHDYPQLRPEWGNFSVAIQHASRLYQWQTVLEYTATLRRAWFTRSRYTEARQAYELAEKAAMALEDEIALAEVLFHRGVADLEQNKFNEAMQLFDRSLELYQELQNPTGIANTYFQMARITNMLSDYEQTTSLLDNALQLRQQMKDEIGIAEIIFRKAALLQNRGLYQEAKLLALEALEQQTVLNDQIGLIRTLHLLVKLTLHIDRTAFAEAEAYSQQALELCEIVNDKAEYALILMILSGIYIYKKEYEQARYYTEQSMKLFQQMGDRRAQAQATYQLGSITHEQGDYHSAYTLVNQSLAVCRELNDRAGIAYVLILLGDILEKKQEIQQAMAAWLEAQKLAQELDHTGLLNLLKTRFPE